MRDGDGRNRTTTTGRRAMVLLFIVPWALCPVSETTASQAEEYKSLLKTVVTVSVSHSPNSERLSVQYAVSYICDAAGVPYQFNKSRLLTDGKCASFVEPLDVNDIPAENALHDLLAPFGLNFEVDDAGLYLVKAPSPSLEELLEGSTVIARIGDALILRDVPANLPAPEMELSPAERVENFETLWEAIDQTYSFFDHKDINWPDIRKQYRPKVEAVSSGEAYLDLLARFVRELRDAHSWLCNYRMDSELPQFSPPVAVRCIEEQAVVTAVANDAAVWEEGPWPGAIVTEVDGLTVAEKIARLRDVLHASSSERNLREVSYRRLLDGQQDSDVAVTFVPPAGELLMQVTLKRTQWSGRDWFETDFPVFKAAHTWYGIHPSGVGYIRILSFDGRLEIAEEFDLALEYLKETPALVIDIRDNLGGFGTAHSSIVGRFIQSRKKVAESYIKDGPGHQDFRAQESYFEPTGSWQYMRPVALVMNSMTGSAADLFACYVISTGRPVTIGSTTHGNLSGVAAFVVLPCGLVVRVSNGYVCGADGRIIEGNGNVPEIEVAPTLSDVIEGRDAVLERAVAELRIRIRTGPSRESRTHDAAAAGTPRPLPEP